MFKYAEKKKEAALSSLIIYWRHPEEHGGYKYLRRFSLDKKLDLKMGKAEPQRAYFREHFIKPNIGKFRLALIFDRQLNICVEAYGYEGEVLDPEGFNNKN